jgi:hypothetical protein
MGFQIDDCRLSESIIWNLEPQVSFVISVVQYYHGTDPVLGVDAL